MGKRLKILTFFIIAIIAMLCLCSCKSKKQLQSVKTVTKDSISVKETIIEKEKLVYSPVDSASIKALVKCPDVKPITVRNKNAVATFQIKNGVAKADCFCDSSAIIFKYNETLKEVFKQHLNTTENVKVIPMPYVPWLYKILSAIGAVAILYFTIKTIKYFKLI